MSSYQFRTAPAEDIEVFALSALAGFAEARERFTALNLTPRTFHHPFAQWLSAKYITGAQLTASGAAALTVGTPTTLSWAEAMAWLRPTDPEWALSRLEAYVIAAAPVWLPERLVEAADQVARGVESRQVCAGLLPALTMLSTGRGVA